MMEDYNANATSQNNLGNLAVEASTKLLVSEAIRV